MKNRLLTLAICVSLLASTQGCGDNHAHKDAATPVDAGPDAGLDASCFTNPQTHEEIINACTSAQKIFKPGKPPLLRADGTLPPLP
jgi:hypothetical protein